MGAKTGDEKFGHALHDDLTRTAICKKIKQKESEGNRRVHLCRRAWKYRIDDGESDKEALMQRCAYVSRRTQLACKNYRPATELTSEGFCEAHVHFFRQLSLHAAAERRRIEKAILNKPEDLYVDDEDETLMTVTSWSCAQQDLYNDLLLDDDDDDPLKNAEVLTDEEVLRCQLDVLERKLLAIRDFRKLIAEKARRRSVFYAKKIAEKRKKGKAKIESKRLRDIQRANRRYHSSHSPKEQYMLRRLKARLDWDGSEERRLDYLKIDNVDASQCTYLIPEEPNIQFNQAMDDRKLITAAHNQIDKESKKIKENAVDEDAEEEVCDTINRLVDNLCEKVALALENEENSASLTCNNANEVLQLIRGHQCCEQTLPNLNHCIKHIYDDPRQHLFVPCIDCGSLALKFGDGLDYCFKHIAKRKQGLSSSWKHWETKITHQGMVNSMDNTTDMKCKLSTEQPQNAVINDESKLRTVSTSGVENIDNESSEPPMKYVIIDEGGEEENGNASTPNTSGIIRQPGNVVQHSMPTSKFNTDDDFSSCARTRPFTTENFHKARLKRGIRYSMPDVKDYLRGDLLNHSLYRSQEQLTKSVVHELLSGGPTKVATSASQLNFSGPRKIIAPLTSLGPKVASKRTIYGTTLNRSGTESSETMSLGPVNGAAAMATSSGSTTPTSSRSFIQRPIVLRNRPASSATLPRQPTHLLPTNASRYIATVGTPRPVQNWRNRSTISLDSRIRRAPANAVLPMDYSNRMGATALGSIRPYLRHRDERQFVAGNARSRLVAIDSLHYTAPRPYPPSSYPIPPYRREVPRPVIYRPRVGTEQKAPPTAETLETAAAVASIAADLETSTDRDVEENEEFTGKHETSSWQKPVTRESSSDRKLHSERQAVTVKSADDNKRSDLRSGSAHANTKQSGVSLTRQSSGESVEDGLAVLAIAAASRTGGTTIQSSPSKKSKYGQLGLEEEEEDE